jgi:hypothetical protein
MYPARAGVKIGYRYQDLLSAFVHIHTSAAYAFAFCSLNILAQQVLRFMAFARII